MAHNITQVLSHNDQKTNCSTRVFYEGTTAEFTGTRRLLEMTGPLNSAAVTDVAIHSMHQKRYQSKLLVVHSKGGRCNFLGFLHCDYRRSPRWSSRDGPQHDCSRSGTFMISITVVPVWLYFSSFLFVLFCFEHKTLYSIGVLAVFVFYHRT